MHEILNPISNPPKVLLWSIKSFYRESFPDESLAPRFLLVVLAQFAPREMTATKGGASNDMDQEGSLPEILLTVTGPTYKVHSHERSRLS